MSEGRGANSNEFVKVKLDRTEIDREGKGRMGACKEDFVLARR